MPNNKIINNFEKIVNKDFGIIKEIIEVSNENGLPPIYRTIAVRNDIVNKNKSVISAIGEAIERYCPSFENQNFITDAYVNMKKKYTNILDINSFSQKSIESNSDKYIDNSKKINWVEGTDLTNNKKIYIPESLVYFPYKIKDDLIREESTTGLACGDTLDMAIYNGICECIERDAFSLCWLNKYISPQIDIETIDDIDLNKVIRKIKEYDLKLYIRNITTNLGIPVYCAIIKNNNYDNNRPIRYIATKAGIDFKSTIMSLLGEALGGYISLAALYSNNISIPQSPKYIKTLEDHSLYYGKYELEHIMKILENDDLKYNFKKELNNKVFNKTEFILNKLKESNIDIYYVDVTTRDIKDLGIYVVRVLSSKLQYLEHNNLSINKYRFKEDIDLLDINKEPYPFS